LGAVRGVHPLSPIRLKHPRSFRTHRGLRAHDEAADPAAPLHVAITVGADGLISQLAAEWGSVGSAWTYTVTYWDLGSTEPIAAPENAQPFPRRTPVAPSTGGGAGNGNS
jgi:hypothetical protein